VGLRGATLQGIGGNSTLRISRSILVTRYYSDYQITKNEMGEACGTRGGDERCMKDSVGIPEGKRPLGRPRPGLEGIIKMNVK
jgi:hypothetical protein